MKSIQISVCFPEYIYIYILGGKLTSAEKFILMRYNDHV